MLRREKVREEIVEDWRRRKMLGITSVLVEEKERIMLGLYIRGFTN